MSSGLERGTPGAGTVAGGEARVKDNHPKADGASVAPSADAVEPEGLVPDTAAAVEFLDKFCREGVHVLTAIPPDGGKTETRTFTPDERKAMAAWIAKRNGEVNLYFTVNALFGPVKSKPNKGAVAAIRALHVDVDPRAGEPLDAERERALRVLLEYDPKPSVIIDSGGGYQGFWLLKEELAVGGSAELARLIWRDAEPGVRGALTDAERAEVEAHEARLWDVVEARNRKVGADLQGDACHNAERIMRLPGTINVPGERKRKKGRTARVARVVEADWTRTHRLEDFDRALKATDGAAKRLHLSAAPARGVDLDDLPVSDLCRSVIVNGHDPDNPNRWDGKLGPDGAWRGDRSKAVFWVTCELVRCGCSDEQMLGVLLDPDLEISAHVREQKNSERYARRQVREAQESVSNSFVTFDNGKPIPNSQQNIRVALRRLGVSLWHDEFAGRDLIGGLEGYGPALDDAAAIRLRLEIDERFGFLPGKDFFYDVLSDQARGNARHPVLEFLASLRWDGVPRIGRWLVEYGGAADTPYVRAVGELVLVAAVRRVRQPGVKFDEMLVLESTQGTNKSSALKLLATREEWFTDDLPLNAESKRVIEALSGKWIVEAGELKGNRKAGNDHLKGFLSRTHDKARMSYDRREREVARQCVIVGTTNDSRYLRDTTGNRRFWPVTVEGFDLEALRRDRDQLWAEAAAREAEGVPIRLDPSLWGDAEIEQNARRVEEPFYERLHDALGEDRPGRLKAEDAWRIVGRQSGHRTQDDNERLGDAMRRLGFDRTKRRFGLPHPEWCYVRGDKYAPHLVPRFGPDGELIGATEAGGGDGKPF